MELLILCNAARIASAQRVVLVVPYFPYAKQNKVKKRGAVPARLMADMMKMAGAHHIITVDLNPAQMLGFFHTPCDNMMIWPLFQQYVLHRKRDWGECIVVAKNPGASKRAARLAKMLDLDIALVLDRGDDDDESGGECHSLFFVPRPACASRSAPSWVPLVAHITSKSSEDSSIHSLTRSLPALINIIYAVLLEDNSCLPPPPPPKNRCCFAFCAALSSSLRSSFSPRPFSPRTC